MSAEQNWMSVMERMEIPLGETIDEIIQTYRDVLTLLTIKSIGRWCQDCHIIHRILISELDRFQILMEEDTSDESSEEEDKNDREDWENSSYPSSIFSDVE